MDIVNITIKLGSGGRRREASAIKKSYRRRLRRVADPYDFLNRKYGK